MADQEFSVTEIDITGAARALAAMDHVKAVARVVVVIGVPLSAFVILGEIHARHPMDHRLLWWAGFTLPAMLLAVLGFSFAVSTMRPLAGAGVLALAVGPALWALFVYSASFGPLEEKWREHVPVVIVLTVFSIPPILAWRKVRRLTPDLLEIARPAPRLTGFGDLWRETFSVWPGVRQGRFKAFLSSLFSHLSTVLLWVGVLIVTPVSFLVFLLLPLLATTKGFLDVVAPVVIILLFLVTMIFLQNSLKNLARWCSRAALADKVEEDPRPPVLFLRSFQDDQVRLPERSRLSALYHRLVNLGRGHRRLDHLLVEKFSRYGPALALGNPGEKSLPFGAARVYASHDSWKEVVADLAEKSGHILLVADSTPGVEWEIHTLFRPEFLPKTLFLCAPRSSDVRENPALREWLDQLGVAPGGVPILGMFLARDERIVLLRSVHPRSSQAFVVALQAFFRFHDSD